MTWLCHKYIMFTVFSNSYINLEPGLALPSFPSKKGEKPVVAYYICFAEYIQVPPQLIQNFKSFLSISVLTSLTHSFLPRTKSQI